MTKIVGGFKDKIVSLFKANTPKQTVYARWKKLKPKAQKQSEENKINSIRNPLILKKKKKEIKNRIIEDWNNWRYLDTFRNRQKNPERIKLNKNKKLMTD